MAASVIAIMRRQPLAWFFVIAFAWTWAFVIVFLILFPLPDIAAVVMSLIPTWAFNHTGGSILIAILIHASLNFSQGLSGDLFPAAKNNEVAPVVALAVLALVIAIATRGRFGYHGHAPSPSPAPAFSAP